MSLPTRISRRGVVILSEENRQRLQRGILSTANPGAPGQGIETLSNWRCFAALSMTIATFLVAGCSSPAFKQKQEARDQRIQRNVELFKAREARSQGNLDELYALHQKMAQRSVVSREWLGHTIEKRIERRQQERRRHMTEFLELFRREEPEQIPVTWGKMFY